MKVRFWGTRGSIATPGAGTVRYGGNTSCVEITTDAGTLLVLDCGTGARALGDWLNATAPTPMCGHIFLTHTHWDHIQGFPFFAPAFVPSNCWVLYGPAQGDEGLEQALAGQMEHRYFPVELSQIAASLEWHDLAEGTFQLEDVTVTCQYLHHPAVTLGYRLEVGGRAVVYCTDHEPCSPTLFHEGQPPSIESIVDVGDSRHVRFLAGADLLIHDAQYTAEEYESKRNWGHSTVDYVVAIAGVAHVRRLGLYHHDPRHNDDALARIEDYARELAARRGWDLEVFAAREGQEIELAEVNDAEPTLRATAHSEPR